MVGLNKYSHDASVCIADEDTGEVLLVWSAAAQESCDSRDSLPPDS